MRARLVIATAVLVVSGVAGPAIAGAETRAPGGGAFVDDRGAPTAVAVDHGGADGGGGSNSAADSDCRWEVVIEDDFAFQVYEEVDGRLVTQHSTTGRWLQRWCEGVGSVAVGGAFAVPEGGLVDPASLAEDALASISVAAPEIHTSPSNQDRLYVRVPTWLWLEPTWWQPYEATAAAGRVSATVTAQPVGTRWSFGDGQSLHCSGPGRPWRPGLPDDSTDCRHDYTTSSATQPTGRFDLTATVELEITWSSNTGQAGTLPAISRTDTVPVEVGEIQAIGTT